VDHNPEHQFASSMAKFNRLYARALANRLQPHGVLPGYLDILFRLWAKDGVTQKALHGLLDVEQATLSNSLARMERDGLLTRTRNPKDRRQTVIRLTQQGRGLQKIVLAAIDDLQSVVNQGLTINDRKYFRRILKQMTGRLEDDLQETVLVLLDEVDH
jgi:DNA-binding MarR family transcriptional regulator